jgi:hypothetical protein
MQHCQFYHKSKVKKGKFTHFRGSSVNLDMSAAAVRRRAEKFERAP